MKLVHYALKKEELTVSSNEKIPLLGMLVQEQVIDVRLAQEWASFYKGYEATPAPIHLSAFFGNGLKGWESLSQLADLLLKEDISKLQFAGEEIAIPQEEVEFLSPAIHLKHSLNIPIFSFQSDSTAFEELLMQATDYDKWLEIACIIGKTGKDIAEEQVENHIFGLSLLNRRTEETALLGSTIVTWDEWKDGGQDRWIRFWVDDRLLYEEHVANILDRKLEIITKASIQQELAAGDVISLGAIKLSTSVQEILNRSAKQGDVICVEVEQLGEWKTKWMDSV